MYIVATRDSIQLLEIRLNDAHYREGSEQIPARNEQVNAEYYNLHDLIKFNAN